ncbi:MAG: VCBS repeat-containing protein [Planctomycetota bacterium]|nr:VCBS repeat-containing protein [Planctomycetota bacterium]
MRRAALPLILRVISISISISAPELFPQDAGPQRRPLRLEFPSDLREGAGPLDWVLSKVAVGRDEWRLEGFAALVEKRLETLAGFLASSSVATGDVTALLDPAFRGRGVLPVRGSVLPGGSGRSAWRGDPASTRTDLDAAGWIADLARLRSLFREVAKARFTVFETRRAAPSGDRLTRTLLEIDGRSPEGHLQVRSDWQLRWRQRGEEWVLGGMALHSFEKAALRDRLFRDVTASALEGCASYRRQLLHGLDHWWKSLDSASGIDIYGHQGVAVGDYDGDGRDDFYVAQPAGLPNLLFRNLGDGRFADVSRKSGVDVLDSTGGPLFVDLDGDGDLDLIVPTSLGVVVLENLDGAGFRPRHESGFHAVSSRQATTMGCAAADFDLDGDLDLYVFSYVFWAGAGSKLHSSYPYPYHDANNGAPNFLFRNEGELRFRDVTRESGMDQNNRRFSLAASWSDFDDDGDPDLYVANDFGKNNLFRNGGNGRFRDVAEELGVEDTGNGMSVTWGDCDADGHIDLYVGNMWSSAGRRIALQPEFGTPELRSLYLRMARGNSLFRNLGGGRFQDATSISGAGFGRWSWSSQFLDVDADGNEDLYVTNGFLSGDSRDDL